MKILVVTSFLLFFFGSNDGVELNCQFKAENWNILPNIYECFVENQIELIYDRSLRDIDAVSGSHVGSRTNDDIKSVWIYSSDVFYFPHGLEIFFTNLEGIYCQYSKLKEIRKDDLKPFPKLRHIDLVSNELQVLEPNLFEANPKLEWIYLHGNQISHIDPKIFDNYLHKLRHLVLSGNVCVFEDAITTKQKANELIKKVQTGTCKDDEKVREFVASAPKRKRTTRRTTPKTTTTESPPIETKKSESSVEFDEKLTELKKIIRDELASEFGKKIEEVKEELKNVKEELAETKEKLETISKLIFEAESDKK